MENNIDKEKKWSYVQNSVYKHLLDVDEWHKNLLRKDMYLLKVRQFFVYDAF